MSELDLGDNTVGNQGATSIADALINNYTLTSLALDNNPIRLVGTMQIPPERILWKL
jgi:hypothetical protein